MTTLPAEITSDDHLNKVAAHWIGLKRSIAAIDEEKEVLAAQVVLAKAAVRKRELQAELLGSFKLYEPLAEQYAKGKLAGQAIRTYRAALIDVAFTACNQILVGVADKAAALKFVGKYCPTAIVTKREVQVSGFTEAFRKLLAKKKPEALAKAGLTVTLPHDNVSFTLKGQQL